jgi:hypothetical protein
MSDLDQTQYAFVTRFLAVSPERTELHRQSKAQAQQLITVAAKAESAATASLTSLADKTGGEMVGLDYRLKSEESLTRKIFDIADATGEDPVEVANDMKDVLRYTTVFAPDKYVEGVKATVAQLLATGHTKKKFKNTWGNKTGYLGINAVFVTPDGAMFELQFHTPQSFHAKDEGTHELYEEQRRYPPGTPRYLELERLQQDVFNEVIRPDGAADLK